MPNVGGGRGVITQARAGLATHVGARSLTRSGYSKPKTYSTERAMKASRGEMKRRGMAVPTHAEVRRVHKKWTTKRRGGKRKAG